MIDLSSIPSSPGCYLLKDAAGKTLYIGKAKQLRRRVASYFAKNHHDEKTTVLVSKVADVEVIVTANEVEALILENNLIKKRKPKYNVDLKDSKRYAYIRLVEEKFPRLVVARSRQEKGTLFGPFVSAQERDVLLRFVNNTFGLRTCRRLPKRACLRWHIGLCSAPCIGKIDQEDYTTRITDSVNVIKGQGDEVIKSMSLSMKRFSADKQYETALRLRNQIRALEGLATKQNMERQKRYDEDIMNYLVENGRVYLCVFNVHKGILENKQDFEFPVSEDFLSQFLVQFYSDAAVPKEVIIPDTIDNAVSDFLSQKRGSAVRVIIPKRGVKKKLLELVKKNIEVTFFGDFKKVQSLGRVLHLNAEPKIIECFDISHISGTSTAGSMVQFRGGRPDKSNYRRFKIRSVEGADDVKAMAEVVRRRYARLVKEESEMPDLVVVDGGKPQLNAALGVFKELGIRIPVIGLAKQFEEIYVPGLSTPLPADKKSAGLRFLQEIRDEAHRFALAYSRLLRRKKVVS
jgi:excinuclease ABC subunit C